MEFPSQRHDVQRPLSQSEREWMYAKRALASRDDPEEVIRRIADFRSSEKSRSFVLGTNHGKESPGRHGPGISKKQLVCANPNKLTSSQLV